MTTIYLLVMNDDIDNEYDDQFDIIGWSDDYARIDLERARLQKLADDVAREKGLAEYRPDKDRWGTGPRTRSHLTYRLIEVPTKF